MNEWKFFVQFCLKTILEPFPFQKILVTFLNIIVIELRSWNFLERAFSRQNCQEFQQDITIRMVPLQGRRNRTLTVKVILQLWDFWCKESISFQCLSGWVIEGKIANKISDIYKFTTVFYLWKGSMQLFIRHIKV